METGTRMDNKTSSLMPSEWRGHEPTRRALSSAPAQDLSGRDGWEHLDVGTEENVAPGVAPGRSPPSPRHRPISSFHWNRGSTGNQISASILR